MVVEEVVQENGEWTDYCECGVIWSAQKKENTK